MMVKKPCCACCDHGKPCAGAPLGAAGTVGVKEHLISIGVLVVAFVLLFPKPPASRR